MRWVADAVTILKRSGDDIDWIVIVGRARALRQALVLRQALGFLARELDVPVPGTALDELDRSPVSRIERVELRTDTRPPRPRRLGYRLAHRRLHYYQSTDVSHRPPFSQFLRHLQSLWGIRRAWQVPVLGLAKILRDLLGLARSGVPEKPE